MSLEVESVTPDSASSAPEAVDNSSTPAIESPSADNSAPEPAEKPDVPLRDRLAKMAADKAAKSAGNTPKEGENDPNKPVEPPKPAAKTPVVPAPDAAGKALETAYKPDYKFRFTDEKQQKQESEFPEWAKSAIKDAESEKEIRSLFEKAHGLDFLKAQSGQRAQQIQTLQGEVSQFRTGIETLKKQYAAGDLGAVFETLKIPEEKILQYALDRANYYQLPAEQKAAIDAQKTAQKQAEAANQQQIQWETQFRQQQAQTKRLQLDMALTRPEVSSVAKTYDERLNKPGAFLEQVILVGETAWYRSNGQVDLTPEQAINYVIANSGLNAAPAGNPAVPAAAPSAPVAAAQPAAAAAPKPPVKVLPHIASRASSAASGKSKPRSIEDLKKLQKERAATG